MKERAILVTLDFGTRSDNASDASAELEELCRASRLLIAKNLIVRQSQPNAALLMGKGKVEELKKLVESEEADVIVCDSELSASQQRNLEEIVQVKTIDRTQLILDIFALRARSTEGKLQVELAQLQYLLPRLSGQGVYLSRLGGGVGTRGPGEQKLEMDRRRLRERIFRLGKELKELQKRRSQAIERKKEKDLPLIALVGYTNAGKSTLFNRLTHANVLVKDQLFSTLDTTTRLLELPGNQKALLVDTVGFVRRLPHHLVEAFKATLEEAVQADILLRVTDGSRIDLKELRRAVDAVLSDLGADKIQSYEVLNKSDLLEADQAVLLAKGQTSDSFLVSSKTGHGVPALLDKISRELSRGRQLKKYFIPKDRLNLLPFLYEQGEVVARKDDSEGSTVQVRLSSKDILRFESRLAGT